MVSGCEVARDLAIEHGADRPIVVHHFRTVSAFGHAEGPQRRQLQTKGQMESNNSSRLTVPHLYAEQVTVLLSVLGLC